MMLTLACQPCFRTQLLVGATAAVLAEKRVADALRALERRASCIICRQICALRARSGELLLRALIGRRRRVAAATLNTIWMRASRATAI